jgi:hypothetical protein
VLAGLWRVLETRTDAEDDLSWDMPDEDGDEACGEESVEGERS